MRALLDTHVWLWMLTEPERLGRLRDVVTDPESDLVLSAASTWEIAIKASIGRLHLPEPVATFVPRRMRSTRVSALAVSHTHAAAVASLPPHHRDPFDRLLVAQARVEGLPVLSADDVLALYDVEVHQP